MRVYSRHMQDTKTNAIRIIIFCFFIGAIIVIMSIVVGGVSTSSLYKGFAQCLTEKKVQFYGAFWCPHCQAQKAAMGEGADYLPYIECSNPDRSQNKTCNDAKIESYPTWVYPNSVSFSSEKNPTICEIQPGSATQDPSCIQNGSKFFKTWIFGDVKFQSATEPTHTGSVWTFAAGSRTVGELDTPEGFQNLANFSSCTLPTASSTTK